jgi:hypothetical protein
MKIKLRKFNNSISWLISFGLSVVGFWLILSERLTLIDAWSGQYHTAAALVGVIVIILLYLAPGIVAYAIFRKYLSSLGYVIGIVTSGLSIYFYYVWLIWSSYTGAP